MMQHDISIIVKRYYKTWWYNSLLLSPGVYYCGYTLYHAHLLYSIIIQ